ncbi:MAG: hypothetical protein P8Y64_07660 [Gammaproteobacteria bacterium]|jgi:hypothetical protein
MPEVPSYQEQIVIAHADLIVGVVKAVQNPDARPELENALKVSEENGWTDLVAAIRRILNGDRNEQILVGLDEEDSTIVQAILRGIQDPSTLPDPNMRPDPSMAAPGLAHMIHDATRGQVQALELLANMAEQMTQAGGDMARVGGIMKRLVDGERDPDKLIKNMNAQTQSLVLSILEELGKLEAH